MNKSYLIKDRAKWNNITDSFTSNDVYFKYGYFVPFQEYGDGEPCLFYYESDSGKVAYPFMLRDIAFSKNLSGKIEEGKYFDISTVYGYGGPLFELSPVCTDLELLKKGFFSSFSDFLKENKIVSQFDRFHPLLKNHEFFDGYSDLLQIRKTIRIDLANEETMLENMERRGRQTVRKARENGITCKIENSKTALNDFFNIYTDTMIKNEAEKYYLFPMSFFESTFSNLPDNHLIMNAYYENKAISTLLVIHKGKYMHSYLGGMYKDYKKLQPSGLLYFESALWGNENGKETYHLGGGYTNGEDPIYKFKKSFNKNGDNDFYIGKKNHDNEKYDFLVELADMKNTESNYFPKYRA